MLSHDIKDVKKAYRCTFTNDLFRQLQPCDDKNVDSLDVPSFGADYSPQTLQLLQRCRKTVIVRDYIPYCMQ